MLDGTIKITGNRLAVGHLSLEQGLTQQRQRWIHHCQIYDITAEHAVITPAIR